MEFQLSDTKLQGKELLDLINNYPKIAIKVATETFFSNKTEMELYPKTEEDGDVTIRCEVATVEVATLNFNTTDSAPTMTGSSVEFQVEFTKYGNHYKFYCILVPDIKDNEIIQITISLYERVCNEETFCDFCHSMTMTDLYYHDFVKYIKNVILNIDKYWYDQIIKRRTERFDGYCKSLLQEIIGDMIRGTIDTIDTMKNFMSELGNPNFSGIKIEDTEYYYIDIGENGGKWLLKEFTLNGISPVDSRVQKTNDSNKSYQSVFRLKFFHSEEDVSNTDWRYEPNPSMGSKLCEVDYSPISTIVYQALSYITTEYNKVYDGYVSKESK